jgi:hypothetical protein
MNPLTAVLFILSAAAILFYSVATRFHLNTIVGLILVIAFYRIVQFKFDLPFGLYIFSLGNAMTNPMSPSAAVGFMLVGVSYFFDLSKRKVVVQQVMLLTVLAGGIFMITAYILDVPEFYSSLQLFPSFQTCILFLFLAFSILLSRPEEGIIKLLVLDLEGSRIGRSFIAVIIAIPILITYLRFIAQRSGWMSFELGGAFVLLSYIIILAAFLFITISSLNTRDQSRKDFVARINTLNAELKEMHDQQVASNEELAASNEEIKTANEELSTINEQLTLATDTIRAQDLIIIEQKEEA